MEKIYVKFDANGRMKEMTARTEPPAHDWVEAPADWDQTTPLRLINGQITVMSADEVASEQLAAAIQEAEVAVRQYAAGVRSQMANHADQYQLAGWNEKARRAERVVANAGTAEDIAILQAECDRRGLNETPEQLAQKQLAKANALAHAVAVIDGLEAYALNLIASAQTQDDLDALLAELQTNAEQALAELAASAAA